MKLPRLTLLDVLILAACWFAFIALGAMSWALTICIFEWFYNLLK